MVNTKRGKLAVSNSVD